MKMEEMEKLRELIERDEELEELESVLLKTEKKIIKFRRELQKDGFFMKAILPGMSDNKLKNYVNHQKAFRLWTKYGKIVNETRMDFEEVYCEVKKLKKESPEIIEERMNDALKNAEQEESKIMGEVKILTEKYHDRYNITAD